MKLTNRGGSATTIEIGDVTVLFSYSTPVAAHVAGVGFFRTREQFSATTSKHINGWLRAEGSGDAIAIPQDMIAGLVKPNREVLERLVLISEDSGAVGSAWVDI